MNRKRNLFEVSPEQNTTKKRNSVANKPTMGVGELTVAELKTILNETLEDKLKDLATKNDFVTLSNELISLKTLNAQLNNKLTVMTERCDLLETQLEILSRKTLEKSIVVHLPLDTETDAIQLAKQTCKGLLKLSEGDELEVNRSKLIHNNNTERGTVVMELPSAEITEKLIAAAHTLKGSGISIFREQSLISRKKRQSLVETRNKLLQVNQNAKILIKGVNKLLINNQLFVYKISRGLIVKSAAEMTFLNELFGDSCYEFFDCSEGKMAPVINSSSSFAHQSQRAPPVDRISQHVREKKQ